MSRIVPNEGETLEEARARRGREARARYYAANKDKILARGREYKKKYRENGVANTDTDYYMRSRYGISLDAYNEMFQRQGGGCAVCGRNQARRLHIDHDHATGAVRGLLCHQCNLALGCVDDSVERLLGLTAYLLETANVLTPVDTETQGVTQ